MTVESILKMITFFIIGFIIGLIDKRCMLDTKSKYIILIILSVILIVVSCMQLMS